MLESQRTFAYSKKELDKDKIDLLHCAIGASTETGELLDAFKKNIYYGKELDLINIGEEIADVMWYLSNLARLCNLDFEVLLQNNINKLKVRYPEKFTNELAMNRNLDAELESLKGNYCSELSLTHLETFKSGWAVRSDGSDLFKRTVISYINKQTMAGFIGDDTDTYYGIRNGYATSMNIRDCRLENITILSLEHFIKIREWVIKIRE